MKKNRKEKLKKMFFFLMLVVIIFSLMGCGNMDSAGYAEKQEKKQNGESTESVAVQPAEAGKEQEKYNFPIPIDAGKLELKSIFSYTGMNPDYEEMYGEEIASIHLKNISGTYLKSAKIYVDLSNGDTLEFLVEDVPADMEIMAFDLQNTVCDAAKCFIEDIRVQADYEEGDAKDLFSWSTSGNEITIENISSQEMQNVTVYYHCTVDGLGYGGISYDAPVGNLQAGESAVTSDTICLVGEVTVVNVTYN